MSGAALNLPAAADPVCEVPSPQSGEVNYAYDVLGRLMQVCYDNGRQVTYVYDHAGNRTEVVVTGGPDPGRAQKLVVLPIGTGFFLIPLPSS